MFEETRALIEQRRARVGATSPRLREMSARLFASSVGPLTRQGQAAEALSSASRRGEAAGGALSAGAGRLRGVVEGGLEGGEAAALRDR